MQMPKHLSRSPYKFHISWETAHLRTAYLHLKFQLLHRFALFKTILDFVFVLLCFFLVFVIDQSSRAQRLKSARFLMKLSFSVKIYAWNFILYFKKFPNLLKIKFFKK